MIAAGEVAECKFWIELAKDEGFAPKISADRLIQEFSKTWFYDS
jgi:hypothetical protein